MAKLLLIEDDPDLSEGLIEALRLEGHDVGHAGDGPAGLQQWRRGGWELLILDIMLPGLSGFEIVERIRHSDPKIPVLLLTARGQEMDKVRGLKLGADDYLTKPFGLMELLARIEALLRRSAAEDQSDQLLAGDLEVDFAARTARRAGRSINLTPREFQILELLFRRRGQAVSRASLLNRIWGLADDVDVATRAVDQHIAMLRRKIEGNPAEPEILETVYGFGYRLAADRS